MNVFLPEITISASVECLDDRRLIKQILEIDTLLDDGKGYNNHPVKVFYRDKKIFLAHYGYICCCEYSQRFGKIHKLHKVFDEYINTNGGFKLKYMHWQDGLYASGSKNSPDFIRETEHYKVRQLFKQKLINKWNNDKISPKWTNSNPPVWYNKEEI